MKSIRVSALVLTLSIVLQALVIAEQKSEQPMTRLSRILQSGQLRVCIWPDYYGISSRNPKTLQLSGVTGDFRELVFSISRDLNPYTVLFELERAGAVHSDENGIQLITKAHQISGDVKKGLNLLGADSDDLMSEASQKPE